MRAPYSGLASEVGPSQAVSELAWSIDHFSDLLVVVYAFLFSSRQDFSHIIPRSVAQATSFSLLDEH